MILGNKIGVTMIKNLFISSLLISFMIIFCSECSLHMLTNDEILTKTDETTWLHFNYAKGCVSATDLVLFQDNNTEKKYINFSQCYRKIAKKLECNQNNIELFIAYIDEGHYTRVKLHNNTYVLLDFLSSKDNILFMKKNLNIFEKIFCCR